MSTKRSRAHAIPAAHDPPDRVTIEFSSRDVMLPWSTREALIVALRESPRGDSGLARAICKAIEDIPARSPVLLTLDHKKYLLRVLEEWSSAAGGYDAIPAGLFELRNELVDDLGDAEQRQATV